MAYFFLDVYGTYLSVTGASQGLGQDGVVDNVPFVLFVFVGWKERRKGRRRRRRRRHL
jgi:hypothetical protein